MLSCRSSLLESLEASIAVMRGMSISGRWTAGRIPSTSPRARHARRGPKVRTGRPANRLQAGWRDPDHGSHKPADSVDPVWRREGRAIDADVHTGWGTRRLRRGGKQGNGSLPRRCGERHAASPRNEPEIPEYFPVRSTLRASSTSAGRVGPTITIRSGWVCWMAESRRPLGLNQIGLDSSDPDPIDDRLVVYSSTRAGGRGGYDLYLGDREGDASWSLSSMGINSPQEKLGICYDRARGVEVARALRLNRPGPR